MTYTQFYQPTTGKFLGVQRSDGTFVPADPGNSDWRSFLTWNAAQPTPLSLSDGPKTARQMRPLSAIYNDLKKLTTGVKSQTVRLWADLSANQTVNGVSGPKYLFEPGANAAAIAVADWMARNSGVTGTALQEAQYRVAALYIQDNPLYAVTPSFDPSINVPGDQLVP